MQQRSCNASCTLVLVLAMIAQSAFGCVYLMGQSPDSVAPASGGTHWTYGMRGADWEGKDAAGNPWTCMAGRKQSPINLHGLCKEHISASKLRTKWYYSPIQSNGTNVQVYNNGHTIQVQWAAGTVKSDVTVATAGKRVTDVLSMEQCDKPVRAKATPLQFHFHTDSEHTVDGVYYPLELHIVHSIPQSELPECPATGCLTVTGIMFKLDDEDKDNPYLESIWDVMPMREGVMVDLPAGKTVEIEALLPSDRSYALYEGSLTTPPCTEGLLWHVLTEPQTLSLKQLEKYAMAVGLKSCELKKAANATTNTNSKSRRLNAGGHIHAPAPTFVRGSYTGFTHMSAEEMQLQGRGLLAETKGNPDDYTCKIVSFGFTNRAVQPLYDRKVYVF